MTACGLALVLLATTCGEGNGPDFCRDGATTLATLGDLDLDPASTEFEEAVDTLEAVDPPDEIADDWNALVDVMVSLRDVESMDPAELSDVAQRFEALNEERLRIDAFIEQDCDVDVGNP